MTFIYSAIDPGISGGVAFFDGNKMEVFSTPICKAQRSGSTRNDFDTTKMADLFRRYSCKDIIAIQESTHAMPGNGGVSMYFFGRGAGIWEGIMAGLGIKYSMVQPQAWKSFYPELLVHTPKSPKGSSEKQKKEYARKRRIAKAAAKAAARKMASTLYPDLANEFKQVNSDGKAEAVLMAHYSFLQYKGKEGQGDK